jgi:two-component system, chemotaxis family, sensor kinase CheA
MPADADFMQRLRRDFAIEAVERTQALHAGLIELERVRDDTRRATLVESIFREAHSLKGAARAVDLLEIERICQALEDNFSAWKRRETEPAVEQFDALHRAADLVRTLAESGAPAPKTELASLLRSLSKRKAGASSVPSSIATPSAGEPAHTASPDTVRIPVAKLDSVLLQAEELLGARLSARFRTEELRSISRQLAHLRREWARSVPDLDVVREMSVPMAAIIGTSQASFESAEERVAALLAALESDRRSLDGMVDQLLEDAKQLVLLPFSTILEGFPRLVRDVARAERKEIDFLITGQDVEVDKRILQEIKDPLVHLLRNAIDHGIEPPAARGGKPPRARIELTVEHAGGSEVELRVADDGAGIDLVRVREAALRNRLITPDEAAGLNDAEATMLIFRSDLSTSEMISSLSGRGLGLAIVREKVEKLGGRVSVDSRPGAGTTFRLFLPVTLSTFHGVVVTASDQRFVLPSTGIERLMRIGLEDIQSAEGRDTILFDGQPIPLTRLDDLLDLPRRPSAPFTELLSPRFPAIVLGDAHDRIAVQVDAVVGEREVLVKPLPKPLLRVRHVAGATILGDGKPAIVLHPPDLLATARSMRPVPASNASNGAPLPVPILIVEDSITSRTLLKAILESAGYVVSTAADGASALAKLKTQDFGLVISDVDMPHMDGFALTEAIRADERLEHTPVILVTARETAEDRDRGSEAGANAYVAKSGFQRGDLLDVIRRFV